MGSTPNAQTWVSAIGGQVNVLVALALEGLLVTLCYALLEACQKGTMMKQLPFPVVATVGVSL